SLSVTSSPLAVTVNAVATSAKFAMKRQLRHDPLAAETVIVAAAAPKVNVGRIVPKPRPMTDTPATSCAIDVAVTVSAWPGMTRTMSPLLAVQSPNAASTVASGAAGSVPGLPSLPFAPEALQTKKNFPVVIGRAGMTGTPNA